MKLIVLVASLLALAFWALARLVAQIQHVITTSWSNGTVTFSKSVTYTGQTENNISIVVATGVTNQQIPDFAFTKAKLQDVFISSDQALTLYTNNPSGSTPQDTLTIAADTPFSWGIASGVANPFVSNVTALYVTTGVIAASANLNIRTLMQSP